NAGQTCVAPDYALIPARRMDEFIEYARAAVEQSFPAGRDYTRIISPTHYARLRSLVDGAVRDGARAIEMMPPDNRVFPPTLLTSVRDNMTAMQEEIFGPVLPLVPYSELNEAIAYVNGRPHPLALYYFDHNGARVRHVLESISAGGATVNDCIFHV